MIEYIRGKMDELTPATAVIDCNGVGYGLSISLNTYSALQGKSEVKLYVHEAIREDAYILYGFADRQERDIFLQLISVSGIGGNTARMILSALTVSELIQAISNGEANVLKSVKGIGLKTAQRIIVDLKDKITAIGAEMNISVTTGEIPAGRSQYAEEAVSALTILGFQQAASQKAVNAILKKQPDLKVQAIIKEALKHL